MYSGSHKYGRGAASRGGGGCGGTNSKRKSFPPPPPPPHRNPPSSSRLSLGGSRSRTPSSPAPPPPPQSADESFRIVGGESLPIASIIKLAPDLVEEIKRLEAHGGAARIKFDVNSPNDGNVIDVGGKEFRFSWTDEFRSCDIYEESQSGEDGNGLLVESGLMWRKMNIYRLFESTSKHVKMRSLECEQTQKSRKAIVLDPGNPSTKSQMKALAAAEASPWKHKQKDFKKKTFEPPQGGHPKPAQRSALSSTSTAKGRRSMSPLPSPQNHSFPVASPSSVRGIVAESQTISESFTPTQARAKAIAAGSPTISENLTPSQVRAKSIADGSEKDFSPSVTGRTIEAVVHRDNQGAGPLDLQHLLITLLKENPKGMSVKAIEKALGDVTSTSARRFDPILKKIATYEPPGRYVLKPGSENMKSSPEDNPQKQFVSESIYGGVPAPDLGFPKGSPFDDLIEQVPLNSQFEKESNLVDNLEPGRQLSDLFGDDEPPDHNGGRTASSSESNSDSDSDSSGSSSDSASRSRSRSRTRSRSPVASAGPSSSDSDSSNSKETSDVEIDIMSDIEKEPNKLQDAGFGLSTTAIPWTMPEANKPVEDGRIGDPDGYESEDVDIDIDIENDFLGDNEAQLTTASHDINISMEKSMTSTSHGQNQPFGVADVVNEKEDTEDKTTYVRSHSKRGSNVLQSVENSNNFKRSKGRAIAQSVVSGHMGSNTSRSPPKSSPDIPNNDQHDNRQYHMSNNFNSIGNANGHLGMESGKNYRVPEKSALSAIQPGRRPPSRSHIIETTERPVENHLHSWPDEKHQEMNVHSLVDIPNQREKGSGNVLVEEASSNEKGNGKYKESLLGLKSSKRSEIPYKIHNERSKNSHALDTLSKRNPGPSLKDGGKPDINRSPVDKRRLQRELSDLELGELREPFPEEPDLSKRQFERVGSFKKSEAKAASSSRKSDLKGVSVNQPTIDPGNASSPNSRGIGRKADFSTKRRSPEPLSEDAIQHQKGLQHVQQQSMSGCADVTVLSDKAVELSKLEPDKSFAKQGTEFEGYGETQRKSYVAAPRGDSRREHVSRKGKGSKSRKSKSLGDGADKKRNISVIEGCTEKRKRNELSSDIDTSYSKYEKEKPELREPIKSISEYDDYVKEFCEKYESYSSLRNILENYSNEFQKLGMDLQSAKGERYNTILAQLRDNYRQCGTRHKRLKKIYVVLHEELAHLKQRIQDFAVNYGRN